MSIMFKDIENKNNRKNMSNHGAFLKNTTLTT